MKSTYTSEHPCVFCHCVAACVWTQSPETLPKCLLSSYAQVSTSHSELPWLSPNTKTTTNTSSLRVFHKMMLHLHETYQYYSSIYIILRETIHHGLIHQVKSSLLYFPQALKSHTAPYHLHAPLSVREVLALLSGWAERWGICLPALRGLIHRAQKRWCDLQ